MALGAGGVLTLVAYFAVLAGICVGVVKRGRGRGEGDERAADGSEDASSNRFFLADKASPWWAVAASLFASNIGAEHFVGLAGVACFSGAAVSFYELGAVVCLLVLGYLFLPVYVNASLSTMPEYMEKRYSAACGQVVVYLSLALYILTKIAATVSEPPASLSPSRPLS